jgi:hypothetical protein
MKKTAKAQHKDRMCMAPQTCEICGGKTPELGLCPRCQDWVEHYAESASAHLFSAVDTAPNNYNPESERPKDA